MDVCHTCASVFSLIWNIGITIIILSHEDVSGVNEPMCESTQNSAWCMENVSHDDDDDDDDDVAQSAKE